MLKFFLHSDVAAMAKGSRTEGGRRFSKTRSKIFDATRTRANHTFLTNIYAICSRVGATSFRIALGKSLVAKAAYRLDASGLHRFTTFGNTFAIVGFLGAFHFKQRF